MLLNTLLLSGSRSWHDRNVPNSRGLRGQLALWKDSAPQPRGNGDLSHVMGLGELKFRTLKCATESLSAIM